MSAIGNIFATPVNAMAAKIAVMSRRMLPVQVMVSTYGAVFASTDPDVAHAQTKIHPDWVVGAYRRAKPADIRNDLVQRMAEIVHYEEPET